MPIEEEIEWAVIRLCSHRSGGGIGDEGGTPEEVAGDGAKGRKCVEGSDNAVEGGY